MSKLYLGSIDLSKIDKLDIVTTDKNGQSFKNGAKYLNVTIWVNEEADKYGNQIGIKAGSKDNSYFIGNAKEYEKKEVSHRPTPTPIENFPEDDLPF